MVDRFRDKIWVWGRVVVSKELRDGCGWEWEMRLWMRDDI